MSRRPKHVVPPVSATGRRFGAHRRKLCPVAVVWLRMMPRKYGCIAAAARQLGVDRQTVVDARFGRSYGEVACREWRHGP